MSLLASLFSLQVDSVQAGVGQYDNLSSMLWSFFSQWTGESVFLRERSDLITCNWVEKAETQQWLESDSTQNQRDELFIHSANRLEQPWRPERVGVRLKLRGGTTNADVKRVLWSTSKP